jgi:hypothetical protein
MGRSGRGGNSIKGLCTGFEEDPRVGAWLQGRRRLDAQIGRLTSSSSARSTSSTARRRKRRGSSSPLERPVVLS